jgi:probable selenium-dependent hydroxylase accessory protein YqeC
MRWRQRSTRSAADIIYLFIFPPGYLVKKSLLDAFGFYGTGMVSIVGAGGKTTLMFRLAGELEKAGHRVLTTTSTKIFKPTTEQSSNVVISEDPIEVVRCAERHSLKGLHLTAAARYDEASDKLLGYAPEAINEIWRSGWFDHILIEADGAARRPLKAPASHEPVIPSETSVLIAVIGLDGVGVPLMADHVFRPDQYTRLTKLPMGAIVTAESVCMVLMHPKGMMKGCPATARQFVFLNKAETPDRQATGREVGQILFSTARDKLCDVLMGSLYHEETGIDRLFAQAAPAKTKKEANAN